MKWFVVGTVTGVVIGLLLGMVIGMMRVVLYYPEPGLGERADDLLRRARQRQAARS